MSHYCIYELGSAVYWQTGRNARWSDKAANVGRASLVGMQGGNECNSEVFGLYELAADGTVLYSRARAGEVLREPTEGMVGRDFFRDVASFENKEDLRHHFRRFIHGDQSVNAFTFDCLYGADVIRAKIFMTRAFETNDEYAGPIVILDIRSAGQ